jgi:Predicted ABC-type transport system involved in lysophospholipase L1 biosynthesis, permease component
MGVRTIFERVILYLTRKKGKTTLLFALVFLIVTFLLICFSLLYATDEVSTYMRTAVGAAFHVRPMGMISTGTDNLITGKLAVITEQEVFQIMSNEHLFYYNGRNTGYTNGISFIKGMGDTEENNMGRIVSNHYTVLAPEFQEGILVLKAGRHITESDKQTIIISELLAAENNLSVGSVVILRPAELSQSENGMFINLLNHSIVEVRAEVIGIFSEHEPQIAMELQPTAGLQSNMIFSDHQLLADLELSHFSEYRNGVSFYLQDPQYLEQVIDHVKQIDIIDTENFFIRADDFEYTKISEGLQAIQNLIRTLLIAVSIVSIVILFLVLVLRMRSRVHEVGVLLSVGIQKKEILGQFISEIVIIALVAFVFAYVVASIISSGGEKYILANLQIIQIEKQMLETGLIRSDIALISTASLYIIRHWIKSLILFLVLIIISIFVLSGIAIENAAQKVAGDVRTAVSGKVTLNIDTSQKNMGMVESSGSSSYQYVGDQITKTTIERLTEIPGVMGYNMSVNSALSAAAVDFEFLPANFPDFGMTPYGDAVLMASTMYSEYFSGFINGNLILESGRHLQPEDERAILISDELAEYNNLNVGDTLELYVEYAGAFPERIIEVKIIGVFSGTRGTGNDPILLTDVPSNQGIIDFATVLELNAEWQPILMPAIPSNALPGALDLFVEDPADIQNIYDQISRHSEVTGKTFILTQETEEFDVIANPLESLQKLVRTLISIIVIVSIAIIALLLTIWTRGRIKEIGILLSNGIEKVEIIGQLIFEAVLIAIVAFGLAYPVSHALADISASLIMSQAADMQSLVQEESITTDIVDENTFNHLSGNSVAEQFSTEIEVTVQLSDLVFVYSIGLFVTVVTVLIASYSVIRLKPREILSKLS